MPTEFIPRPYQRATMRHLRKNPYAALFLDMGLGKTVSTLTVLKERLNDFDIITPLIIAPKLVCEHTWPVEIKKWAHLSGLKVSVIKGDPKERRAALKRNADLYIVGRQNFQWLVELYGERNWPFDCVVADESTTFKNHESKRTRCLWHVRPKINYLWLLTGTPTPAGLIDLWAQVHLLDGGKRLYKNITTYRQEYFFENPNGFGWTHRRNSEQEIFDKIKDICISIKSEGNVDLPERVDIVKEIELESYTEYKQFKKDRVRVTGCGHYGV